MFTQNTLFCLALFLTRAVELSFSVIPLMLQFQSIIEQYLEGNCFHYFVKSSWLSSSQICLSSWSILNIESKIMIHFYIYLLKCKNILAHFIFSITKSKIEKYTFQRWFSAFHGDDAYQDSSLFFFLHSDVLNHIFLKPTCKTLHP